MGQGLRSPARRRSPLRRLFDWMLVLGIILIATTLLAVVALLVGERAFSQRIYPSITVRGVGVGGLPGPAARQAIEQHYRAFLQHPVTLIYGDQRWQPSAAALGIRLVSDEAVAAAFAYGHYDTRLDNLRTAAAVWEQGVDLPLRVEVDQAAMQRYVASLAAAVDTLPENADVRLNGAQIVVVPEIWGRQLLVDEMVAEITAAAQRLEPQQIPLRTRALTPTVRDADVAPAAAELRTLLRGPFVLSGESGVCGAGCRWEWPLEQIATWISLRHLRDPAGRTTIAVRVDEGAIRSALLPIAPELREEGTLPRVTWNGGDLRIAVPGDPGRGLDADQALSQISATLYSGDRQIALPLTPIPPPVTESNLASLGITNQVGLGVSSFAESADYRITNIRAGARQMDNLLIPPGGSFSFNSTLGAVTAERGFVEGLAIIENRTQKEWGGGLCQVSTTVFRAAFFAGLPIQERHEHSFRISWYEELGEPPGLDAAIFTGVYDMRFVNDTDGWLLMQSYVDLDNQRLSVALYGPPSNRSVAYDHRIIERTPAPTEPVYVDDPEEPRGSVRKSDTARGGLKVAVYRTVRANDQVLYQDTFPTEFKPWPDIYVRGTGQ